MILSIFKCFHSCIIFGKLFKPFAFLEIFCVFFSNYWFIYIWIRCIWDFLGDTSSKEFACQCRRHKSHGFAPCVRKIPWRRKWQPTPVFLPGKSHGQRSLAGYSPWGHKESDMMKSLSTPLYMRCVICKYFSLVHGLSFHYFNVFCRGKVFNFDEVQDQFFSSIDHAFGVVSRKSLLNPSIHNNKIPCTGGLNNRHLFLTFIFQFWRLGSWKARCHRLGFWWEPFSWFADCLPVVSSYGRGKGCLFL